MSIPKFLYSRKFIYAALGVISGLFIWGASAALITLFPAGQAAYVALFHGILPYIAGIIAALLGVHSWMDFKTIASNQVNLSSSISKVEYVKRNLPNWHKQAFEATGEPFDYSPDGESMKDEGGANG